MELKVIETSLFGANCYILSTRDKKALVVDPGSADKRIKNYIVENGLDITHILLTHGHFDHISGVDMLKELCAEARVMINKKDALALKDARLNRSGFFGRQAVIVNSPVFAYVEDKDVIHFSSLEVKALATPGHTPGGMSFYVEKEGLVFTGDALFAGDIGRTDFDDGDYDLLVESIKSNLYTLPPLTRVLPGHGGESTIEKEKKFNNYVRQ